MKSKTLPYFPFYPADFLAKTGRLTDEQVGSYVRLLCEQWISGDIPLVHANGDASALRMLTESIERSWQYISKYFVIDGNGMKNQRMEEERVKAIDIHGKRVKSAHARWSKDDVSGDANGDASASATQNSEPISHNTEERKQQLKEIVLFFPDGFFPDMAIPELMIGIKEEYGQKAFEVLRDKVGNLTDRKLRTGRYIRGIIKGTDFESISKGLTNSSGKALEWLTRAQAEKKAEGDKSRKTTDQLFHVLKIKGDLVKFPADHRYSGQTVWVSK